MKPLLEVRDVSLSYHRVDGETAALSHISFALYPGEFLAIVGPSGCGKSTLLNLICGLLIPGEGEILLDGAPVAENTARIGYMLQKDHLLEWRTVYKNVLLGLEIRREITPERLAFIDEMLKSYGLEKFKNARPAQLSGGMRQRAALIRTLALKPDLLLLDEPFSALDYQTRLTVSDDIGKILKKEKKPAILVTHDISEAISMADRVLVLSRRPAAVQRVVPISLGIENRTPLSSRNAPEFKTYFNLIWKELNKPGTSLSGNDSAKAAGHSEAGIQETGMQETDMQKTGMQEADMQKTGMQEADMQKTGMQKTGMQKTGMQKTGMPKAAAQEGGSHE